MWERRLAHRWSGLADRTIGREGLACREAENVARALERGWPALYRQAPQLVCPYCYRSTDLDGLDRRRTDNRHARSRILAAHSAAADRLRPVARPSSTFTYCRRPTTITQTRTGWPARADCITKMHEIQLDSTVMPRRYVWPVWIGWLHWPFVDISELW